MSRTPSRLSVRLRSEDGVSLIHLGMLLLVLMGFCTFVMDYGVLWLARGQAQNAADSGALAAAIARIYDEPANPPSYSPPGAAMQSANIEVDRHNVIGVAPARQVYFEDTIPNLPPTCVAGVGNPTPRCVQVEVFRNSANSNPLPTFFANAFGITSQNIRATATSKLMAANWAECLRPWMVMDKWTDLNGNGMFDPGTGEYTAPGYKYPDDVGTVITLAAGDPSTSLGPSAYFRIDLTGGGQSAYADNIRTCAQVTPTVSFLTLPGGGSGPQTDGAVQDLLASTPPPVIVPLLLFSPEVWYTIDRTSGRIDLPIVNMLGFQILSSDRTGAVTGKFVTLAGELRADGPPALSGGGGGFVQVPVLVR
jgi:hypothetical protein